jgi:hypothetical protein
MKPRKWVFVVFLCVLIAVFGLFQGRRHLEKNRNIEQFLIKQLSASTGGEFSVEKIRLGFFSVYLQNVKASLSMRTFNLSVRDIKVGFSLWRIIRSRGNVSQGINKIILFSPLLEIRLAQKSLPGSIGSASSVPATSPNALSGFPIKHLLIRKGAMTVSIGDGSPAILGEDLSGRVTNNDAAVLFDLRGCMASSGKNLFFSAAFSKTGAKHRISLRLNKAQIRKPFNLGKAQITGGLFDGAFEVSFPDSVTARNFESAGWCTISRGACTISGLPAPLTAVNCAAAISNTMVRVDSLTCRMKNIGIAGKGAWDLGTENLKESCITLRAAGIRPEAFAVQPSSLMKNVTGKGWAEVKLMKQKYPARTGFTCLAGGVNLYGQALTLVHGSGSIDKSQVTADTLVITGPSLRVLGSGIVNYEKKPTAYSFTFKADADSIASAPDLRGRLSAQGTMRGLGKTYFLDAVLMGRSLRFGGILLGSPELRIATSEGKGISFSSFETNSDYFSIDGVVDSLAGGSPCIAFNAKAGPRLLKEAIAASQPTLAKEIDSAWAQASFKGTVKKFSARGFAGLTVVSDRDLPRIRGSIGVQLDKKEADKAVHWQVFQRDFSISDSLVPLRGQGTVCGDSLRIDSLQALLGIKAGGIVRFGKVAGVDLDVRYRDASLSMLNTMLFARRLPFLAGLLSGSTRLSGSLEKIRTDSELHLKGASVSMFSGIEADAVVQTRDTVFTVLPMVIRQNGAALMQVDTVTNKNGLRFSGSIDDLDVASIIGRLLPEEYFKEEHEIKGALSGNFSSTQSGLAAKVELRSNWISVDAWRLDRLKTSLKVNERGLYVESFTAEDSLRSRVTAKGFIPWSVIADQENDSDTLDMQASISGDLLASTEHNASVPFFLPIGGHGMGTLDAAVKGTLGNIRLIKAAVQIPQGVLRVRPFVQEDIKDFSLRIALANTSGSSAEPDQSHNDDEVIDKAEISTLLTGSIGRRPIRIHSTHTIPAGFEPIKLGFLDFGAMLISTPKRGVDIHVPGLMEIGALGDIEFAAKPPFPEFALSGPIDHLCITGAWILRTCDVTFPILDNVETRVKFDPFPFINWNMDLRVGNRNVQYYYDTGKNRKLMRLVELSIDPVSVLSLRGRVTDNTFSLLNSLRSTKGSIFFGRIFNRNVDIGLDFVPERIPDRRGYNNLPIIWGSAEAMSDTSRFDRIKLSLIVRDSVTGAWSERGRLYDIHFRVGADIEAIPGEGQKQFVADEGKRYGSLGGAGRFVSAMGEQYLHRVLLQNFERRLAKTLGLDVINVETSIASNYFNKLYNRQFDLNKWGYLTFANVGITLGRYILYDKVFLKWRTELVPVDTLLRPEYNVGFEFQPLQNLILDVNYGIYKGAKSLETNPKVNLWLQLPIKDVRNFFDF